MSVTYLSPDIYVLSLLFLHRLLQYFYWPTCAWTHEENEPYSRAIAWLSNH
jgi:hypothetical protein